MACCGVPQREPLLASLRPVRGSPEAGGPQSRGLQPRGPNTPGGRQPRFRPLPQALAQPAACEQGGQESHPTQGLGFCSTAGGTRTNSTCLRWRSACIKSITYSILYSPSYMSKKMVELQYCHSWAEGS